MQSHVISKMAFTQRKSIRRVVRSLSGLTIGLVGASDMGSAIIHRFHGSLEWPIVSISNRVSAQTFTVVAGFFLIVLSYGLARGKHHAWNITLGLLLLTTLLSVQRSATILATIIALGAAVVLYCLEPFFKAKSDPPSARRGYIALALGIGIVVFYTIGGFIALHNEFEPWIDRFGIRGVLIHMFAYRGLHFPHDTQAFFFQRALPLLCISAILYGMVQIFRPVAAVLIPDHDTRAQVNHLTHTYGTNSISYFAMDEDKSFFFSDSGQSVISYVLQGSTAVVAGDPIGPEEEIASVIRQFVDFCREQDWTIVFWQVRDTTAKLYRAAGFHLLKIGEDAIIDVQKFTLKGGAISNVRSSAKRAEKDGLRIIFYHGQVLDGAQLAQMEKISRHWLAEKGGSEMGFSMGHFTIQGDPEQIYALAVDEQNKVHAFVSFIPIYGRLGWGLDLMRRAEQCAPGTMELLLARSIEYMKSSGSLTVSLGVAPLSNANGEDETFLDTGIDFLTKRFGNPSKNQSLYNFKKKFLPTWESRYLVYSDALNLPKIGLALYNAHQPDSSLIGTLRKTLADWKHNRQRQQEQHQAKAIETAKI
jgi:phosphatidylglycerol lysyltransferase